MLTLITLTCLLFLKSPITNCNYRYLRCSILQNTSLRYVSKKNFIIFYSITPISLQLSWSYSKKKQKAQSILPRRRFFLPPLLRGQLFYQNEVAFKNVIRLSLLSKTLPDWPCCQKHCQTEKGEKGHQTEISIKNLTRLILVSKTLPDWACSEKGRQTELSIKNLTRLTLLSKTLPDWTCSEKCHQIDLVEFR